MPCWDYAIKPLKSKEPVSSPWDGERMISVVMGGFAIECYKERHHTLKQKHKEMIFMEREPCRGPLSDILFYT